VIPEASCSLTVSSAISLPEIYNRHSNTQEEANSTRHVDSTEFTNNCKQPTLLTGQTPNNEILRLECCRVGELQQTPHQATPYQPS